MIENIHPMTAVAVLDRCHIACVTIGVNHKAVEDHQQSRKVWDLARKRLGVYGRGHISLRIEVQLDEERIRLRGPVYESIRDWQPKVLSDSVRDELIGDYVSVPICRIVTFPDCGPLVASNRNPAGFASALLIRGHTGPDDQRVG